MNYWNFVGYQEHVGDTTEGGANVKCNNEFRLNPIISLSLQRHAGHAG